MMNCDAHSWLLFKRIQACYIHSCYQQVYIVCAFIGNYDFQVHHVAHNAVFAGNAHAAKYLAGFAGYI